MTNAPSIKRTQAEEALIAQFDAGNVFAGDAADVVAARRDAFDRLRESGLPHRRVEAYKYTDLRKLMRSAPPIAGPMDAGQLAAAIAAAKPETADLNPTVMAIANGEVVSGLDNQWPAGLTLSRLADILTGGSAVIEQLPAIEEFAADPLVELNTAFMSDGVIAQVGVDAQIAQPIELLHLADGTESARYVRHKISVGPGASITLIDRHLGPADCAYHANSVIELHVGAGANVRLIRLQEEGNAALHFSSIAIRLDEKAILNQFTLTTGAAVSRAQTFCHLAGSNADAAIRGATLIGHRQHADMTINVDHAVGDCQSHELFKTVVDDEARAVFQGRIGVRQYADGSDGRMMSNALLLSEGSEIITKPELEIFADDVQCAHGATSGELDDDLMFYLRSRGLPERQARQLLITAFIAQAIEEIGDEDIEAVIKTRAEGWLSERAQSHDN